MGVGENLVERRWLDSITSDRITEERLQGRRKGVIVFFLRRGYASRGVGVCLGLNGKSKEYRFQMRRWVLTYPYSHPRPPDDLLGASYPNPDICFADKQLLYQRVETFAPSRAFALHIPWREHADPRQEHRIEANLAKTNPESTLCPLTVPLAVPLSPSSIRILGELERKRNRK